MENYSALGTRDAVELLENEHTELMELFERFEDIGMNTFINRKKLTDAIWQRFLSHMRLEESVFYPTVRENVVGIKDLVTEMSNDNMSTRILISELESMTPDDDLFDMKVRILYEHIDKHIDTQEGEMFPDVRDSNLDLIELGNRIAKRRSELEYEMDH